MFTIYICIIQIAEVEKIKNFVCPICREKKAKKSSSSRGGSSFANKRRKPDSGTGHSSSGPPAKKRHAGRSGVDSDEDYVEGGISKSSGHGGSKHLLEPLLFNDEAEYNLTDDSSEDEELGQEVPESAPDLHRQPKSDPVPLVQRGLGIPTMAQWRRYQRTPTASFGDQVQQIATENDDRGLAFFQGLLKNKALSAYDRERQLLEYLQGK